MGACVRMLNATFGSSLACDRVLFCLTTSPPAVSPLGFLAPSLFPSLSGRYTSSAGTPFGGKGEMETLWKRVLRLFGVAGDTGQSQPFCRRPVYVPRRKYPYLSPPGK